MKKYFLSIVALAGMLFATSCQESLVEPQMEGPTTFTVQLPDQMGTKAIGSKTNVNQLLVAVYQEASVDGATAIYRQTAEVKNGEATISLNLIKGQSYDVIFWAQKDNGYVDVNTQFELVNIPVENKHHNDDNGAAFFFYKENFVPSGVAESVTLKRPFAQLNLGTTAASLITDAGTVAIATSAITVGNVASSFNTVLGYGQGEQTLVFAAKEEPQQILTVGNDDYVYVSMDYLPISGDDEAVVTVEAQITLNNTQVVSHKFTNVPVRENYRTNIVGNLISSSSEFTVKVDDSWAGADYNEEYVAPGIRLVNGEYEITSEEGLWSLAEIVNGGTKALTASDFSGKTVKLTCDIDLKNEPWTPIGGVGLVHFSGVFDGNDHKISNLLVMPASDDDNSYKGLFGAARGIIKNLTLENVNVKGHSKVGALVGDGQNAKIEKCKVIGGSVISTPANGLKGNNVGGLVGYLYADGKSETYAFVNNCSVENLTVKAYSDVAGLVGTVGCTSGSKEATVVGNTIKNVFVIADQSVEHNETRNPNAGEVYGRTAGDVNKINISQNTTEEVIVSVIEKDVDIADEIQDAAEGAVVAIPAGEYTTLPTPENKITIVCVEGTVFNGTSSLNIKGSTVIGATFENEDGSSVSSTINGVFENCTFRGKNALRYCYAGENVIFRNCVFDGVTYGVHFDAGTNDATFENCVFSGFNAFGAALTQLNLIECTFRPLGNSGYNGINMWGNTKLENCNFEFDGAHSEWIDAVNNGKKLEFNGCKVNGEPLSIDRVGDYGEGNIIIIDGKWYVSTEQTFVDALLAKPVGIVLTSDIIIERDWDNRSTGAKTTQPIVIDGNEYTLKFTGKVSDGFNYHSAFRFEASAEVRNLTIDMSQVAETGSWLRAISASSNLLIDNCSFIGSENYTKDNAVVIGDSNVSSQIDIKAEITNSEFTNWRRGISDNENAKEVREINISDNKFTNANVYVSAYGNIRFDGNEMDNSLINITSYTNAANAKVNAQNNTLDSDLSDYNVIGSSSKKFNAENVNAQDGFVVYTL